MRAQLVFLKSDINRALLERGSCSPPFQFGVPFNHAYIPELARKHLRTPLFFEREKATPRFGGGGWWYWRPFISSVFGSGVWGVFGRRRLHEGDCTY